MPANQLVQDEHCRLAVFGNLHRLDAWRRLLDLRTAIAGMVGVRERADLVGFRIATSLQIHGLRECNLEPGGLDRDALNFEGHFAVPFHPLESEWFGAAH